MYYDYSGSPVIAKAPRKEGPCPKCHVIGKLTSHHVYPRRHFGGGGIIEYLCRKCHDVVELIIRTAEDFIPARRFQREFYRKLWYFFLEAPLSVSYGIWSERTGSRKGRIERHVRFQDSHSLRQKIRDWAKKLENLISNFIDEVVEVSPICRRNPKQQRRYERRVVRQRYRNMTRKMRVMRAA